MEMRRTICYNCFQEKPDAAGPCPHCGFDLAENEKKFPVALRAGTVLNGRYIVGRVLGQGGFGITYLALDTQLNAKVAIKEFMPGEIATRQGTTVSVMMDTKSEEFAYGAERFQEEARTLAKFIGNPNIAAVTSYFDENDTSYFVMDYIEGISPSRPTSPTTAGRSAVEETLNVMIPVLRALTAVHAEGFIHRDVTPGQHLHHQGRHGEAAGLRLGEILHRRQVQEPRRDFESRLRAERTVHPPEPPGALHRRLLLRGVLLCGPHRLPAAGEFWSGWTTTTWSPSPSAGIEIPEYLDKAILKGLAVQPEDRFQSLRRSSWTPSSASGWWRCPSPAVRRPSPPPAASWTPSSPR